VSQMLRHDRVTVRWCGDVETSSTDARWLVEVARDGVMGEFETRLLVPNARRVGVIVKDWRGAEFEPLADALRLLVDHLFERASPHRLDLDACSTEVHVISAALRCGFAEEGRRRHVRIVDGRWQDRVSLGLLASAWSGGCHVTEVHVAPSKGEPLVADLPVIPRPSAADFSLLRGRRMTLRRRRPSDQDLFYRWQCRPEWWQLWMPEHPDGFSSPSRHKFDAAWQGSPRTGEWVVETEHGTPLGVCFYCSMDRQNRSAEADILLYEAEFWGQGYGTEALGVMLRHLFHDLKLHRVSSGTWSGNIGSLRVQQKNRLQIEVRSPESYLVEGKWYDGLGTGILETDEGA